MDIYGNDYGKMLSSSFPEKCITCSKDILPSLCCSIMYLKKVGVLLQVELTMDVSLIAPKGTGI